MSVAASCSESSRKLRLRSRTVTRHAGVNAVSRPLTLEAMNLDGIRGVTRFCARHERTIDNPARDCPEPGWLAALPSLLTGWWSSAELSFNNYEVLTMRRGSSGRPSAPLEKDGRVTDPREADFEAERPKASRRRKSWEQSLVRSLKRARPESCHP
jgi:hypothetical protein